MGITSTYAAITLYEAKEVGYDNSSSGTSEVDVQGAIDELYELSNTCTFDEQTGAEMLVAKANDISVIDYATGNKGEMYTFYHSATEHAETLLDYRYIGNIPNNYIEFNNELWRIIGVFDGRIKIIKDVAIDNLMWDYKRDGVGSSIGYGSNDWSDAQLMYLLNKHDYQLKEGYTLDGNLIRDSKNNIIYQIGCNPAMINPGASYTCTENAWQLNETALQQIDTVTWYLAGNDLLSISADTFYQRERWTRVYSGRPSLWEGEVGLIYPSDYLYTYAYGIDDNCFQNATNCKTNPSSSWLYDGTEQWTITQFSMYGWYVIYIGADGNLNSFDARVTHMVRPVVYLNQDILLSDMIGTMDDPYVIVTK